jgi:chemotaxis methyl-accepting protein methylase
MTATLPQRNPEDPAVAIEDRLSAIIGRETGLRQRPREAAALRAWIGERVRTLGLRDIHEFEQLLGQDTPVARSERQLLNERLTTGESYFFRDAGQIELLAGTILPELIARRAARRRLRIWSAGCSTGEEAYTLAMLIDEIGPSLASWNIQIVASDINLDALDKARRGRYTAWSLRTTNATRKARYFEPCGSRWQIAPRLRDRVSFRALDLVRDRFPDPDAGLVEFDLILCRNVFIYLNEGAIRAVTAKFASAIVEGGYLVTGHSELFALDPSPLRIRMYPQSAAYQQVSASDVEAGALPARAARSTAIGPQGGEGTAPQGALSRSGLRRGLPATRCAPRAGERRRCVTPDVPDGANHPAAAARDRGDSAVRHVNRRGGPRLRGPHAGARGDLANGQAPPRVRIAGQPLRDRRGRSARDRLAPRAFARRGIAARCRGSLRSATWRTASATRRCSMRSPAQAEFCKLAVEARCPDLLTDTQTRRSYGRRCEDGDRRGQPPYGSRALPARTDGAGAPVPTQPA